MYIVSSCVHNVLLVVDHDTVVLIFMEKSTDFAVIFQVAHLDLAIHQTECLQEHAALALTFIPRTWRFHTSGTRSM